MTILHGENGDHGDFGPLADVVEGRLSWAEARGVWHPKTDLGRAAKVACEAMVQRGVCVTLPGLVSFADKYGACELLRLELECVGLLDPVGPAC